VREHSREFGASGEKEEEKGGETKGSPGNREVVGDC